MAGEGVRSWAARAVMEAFLGLGLPERAGLPQTSQILRTLTGEARLSLEAGGPFPGGAERSSLALAHISSDTERKAAAQDLTQRSTSNSTGIC